MTEKIEITGTVEAVMPTQDFPSGFKKRILVVNTGGEYPQMIPVEFTKDKCDALNSLSIGQTITAHVNLRGNEYNGKYYASIQGWRFDAGNEPARTAAHSSSARKSEPDKYGEDDGDEVPF